MFPANDLNSFSDRQKIRNYVCIVRTLFCVKKKWYTLFTDYGGIGFYIRNDLSYIIRNDFSTYNPDFQSLWIEIQSKTNSNMICGVIYRHPNISKFETFKNYLDPILDKISKEKKYCIMMGDFNINLLNFETHLPTEDLLILLALIFFFLKFYNPQE